jgi:iron complex transport system ATP-binding protein
MFLQAEGICVERGGRRVVGELDLELAEGQCLAIVGPNGAGKTTLMQALLGLLPLESGVVRLEDRPLQRVGRRQIARQIAYLPQSYEGYLGFSVRDVVQTGRYAHRGPAGSWNETDSMAVDEAIEQCHLEHLQARRVQTLSGGERQKVWLAAALAQKSPALFLDEPTSALDPKHQVELIRLMQAQLATGKTLVLVCHDLNLPAILRCSVLALRNGRKVFEGPVDKFLDLELLKDIFETGFQLVELEPDRSRRIYLRV